MLLSLVVLRTSAFSFYSEPYHLAAGKAAYTIDKEPKHLPLYLPSGLDAPHKVYKHRRAPGNSPFPEGDAASMRIDLIWPDRISSIIVGLSSIGPFGSCNGDSVRGFDGAEPTNFQPSNQIAFILLAL